MVTGDHGLNAPLEARERKRKRNRDVRQELSPFQTICPNQWHPFTRIGENELYFIQKSYTYRPSFVTAHSRASKLFLSSDGIVDMHQNVKKWFAREARQTFIRTWEHYLLISKPAVWQGASSFNPPWPIWTLSVISTSQAFFSASYFLLFPPSRNPSPLFWPLLTRLICLSRRWQRRPIQLPETLTTACSRALQGLRAPSLLIGRRPW